jgi:regulator of replication initiation timing
MKRTNKVFKLSLLLLLVINFIIPLQAFAGVSTKMVEVASEDRKALQECMVGLEECIEDKERIQSTLNSRINDLLAQVNQFKSENSNLQKQVNDLRMDNTVLVKKIEELKTSVTEKVATEVPQAQAKPKSVKETKSASESGSGFCLACKVGHVIGPVVALPVGAVAGTVRGAANKGTSYADKGSETLGESLPGQVVGKLGGGILGTVVGAVSGLFRGLYNGLRYGLTRPFSAESFSLAGQFVEDFNPTDFRN